MAHQYRQRILVTLRASGEPGGILWRGAAYSVAEVLARWHLRDRWWEARDGQADVADEQHRGTEVPVHEADGLKSRDARGDPCRPVSHELTEDRRSMSADFSPQEPYAGTGRGVRWTPSGPRLSPAPSDRYYYRLRCVEGLLCEVYWDAACDAWTLDRVLD